MEQANERTEEWVVTANALADGGVRYLTPARSWTQDLQHAWFGPKPAAESMQGWARGEEAIVCDPYVIVADREDGVLTPRSQRERIRAEGPVPTLIRLGYAAPAATPHRRAV